MLQSPSGWVKNLADSLMRQGYETYMAHMVEVDKSRFDGNFIPTVSEFLDVFPKELSSLLSKREIEFSIELILGRCQYLWPRT